MEMDNKEFVKSVLKKLAKLEYIKPEEIPNIDLYMDQVTTFMESHLGEVKRFEDDKILTKTMINNYTKNELLPSPVKKKYSKEHLIVLIFIYYYKNILSISDIQKLLDPITENFFDKKGATSMENIYNEIYRLERAQLVSVSKDITAKCLLTDDAFTNVKDPADREFLQLFSFVSLLSFDIFLKKSIIENIIDDLLTTEDDVADTTDKNSQKTKEKAQKSAQKTKEKAKKNK